MGTVARAVRPQVGLMLSCGEAPDGNRNFPKKLDYIRAKPGALGQFDETAKRFHEVYGDQPRSIDVIFVEDAIGSVLDVRPKVYGTSRLKAMGNDNLAELSPQEFAEAIQAFNWDLTTYPEDSPEPGTYTVRGRDDSAVTKLNLKVYATLRVALPKVTGLMLVTEITTTSLRTMSNWHNGLSMALSITGGVLVGIPFMLSLRPARTSFYDPKDKRRKPSQFFEWVLDSAHSVEQLYEIAGERRQVLASGQAPLALPPVRHEDVERDREVSEALWGTDEERRVQSALADVPAAQADVPTREEPQVSASDALLNKIARLETQVGSESAAVVLRGVFGKESVVELTPEQAERYADTLEKSVDPGLGGDVETVEEGEVEDGLSTDLPDAPSDDLSGPIEDAEFAPVDESAPAPESPLAEPEPLPGEPTGGLMAPVDVAGDLPIPIGANRGKKLVDLNDDEWLAWALRNGARFQGHEAFYAGLELWVRERKPDVWNEARS